MGKTHLFDFEHDQKIPKHDENKLIGYKGTICGYQSNQVSNNKSEVTCKKCIKEIANK